MSPSDILGQHILLAKYIDYCQEFSHFTGSCIFKNQRLIFPLAAILPDY
jgi:hypothetical protein